jgi:acetyl/propionyl-CoA carboxylase alpha subunit
MPAGPGVRVDTATEEGERIPPEYDSLMAKLMVHAADRAGAIERLRRALDEVEIGGIQSTLPFHRAVAADPAFAAGALSTGWVAERWDGHAARASAYRLAAIAAGLATISSGEPEAAGHPSSNGASPAAGSERADGWRIAARAAMVDRWPAR